MSQAVATYGAQLAGQVLNTALSRLGESKAARNVLVPARPKAPSANRGKGNQQTERSKRGSMHTSAMTNSVPQGGAAPRATALPRPPKVGLSDLQAHHVCWQAGTVFIGKTSTLGTDGAVYMRTRTDTIIVPNAAGLGSGLNQNVGACPVGMGDAVVGSSYGAQLEQLYARRRVRKVLVHFWPVTSSTSNDMTLFVAPGRGPYSIGISSAGSPATANPVTDIVSMDGVRTFRVWESCTLDLTPYIAGGSGAAQNEFDNQVGADGQNSALSQGPSDWVGRVPCSFLVAGQNNNMPTNTSTHLIFVEAWFDFLDFVGASMVGFPQCFPPGFTHLGKERKDPPPPPGSGASSVIRCDTVKSHLETDAKEERWVKIVEPPDNKPSGGALHESKSTIPQCVVPPSGPPRLWSSLMK